MSFEKKILFKFDDVNFILYIHVMNFITAIILIQNNNSKFICLFKNFRLKQTTKIDYFNAYHVKNEKIINLAIKHSKTIHQKIYFEKLLRVCAFFIKIEIEFFFNTISIVQIIEKIIIYNANQSLINQFIQLMN